jgi:hypothetical protein
LREEDFVKAGRWMEWSLDYKEWWSDTDDYESKKIKASAKRIKYKGKISKGFELEEYIIDELDMLASLINRLSGNIL